MPEEILEGEELTPEQVFEIEKAKKLISYLSALIAAKEEIARYNAELEKPPEPTPDPELQKTITSNKVLAGDGDKALLLGTFSTAPTIDAKALQDLGYAAVDAEAAIAERDKLRTEAIAIAPVVITPKVGGK
jgi:hypothetical protein